MTREAMASLTVPQLLELAIELDRRNRAAVHQIDNDWAAGTFNKAAVVRTLKGETPRPPTAPVGPIDYSPAASLAHNKELAS